MHINIFFPWFLTFSFFFLPYCFVLTAMVMMRFHLLRPSLRRDVVSSISRRREPSAVSEVISRCDKPAAERKSEHKAVVKILGRRERWLLLLSFSNRKEGICSHNGLCHYQLENKLVVSVFK